VTKDLHRRNVEAMIQADQMDQLKSYLERGRRFEALDVEELGKRSLEAQEVAYADGDDSRMQEAQDLEAEFRARKLEPPLPPQEVVERMVRRIERLNEQPEARENVRRAARVFLDSLDRKPD
jgi:hypothetical protein